MTAGTQALARALQETPRGTGWTQGGKRQRWADLPDELRRFVAKDAAAILAALSESDAITLAAELLAAHPERLAEALIAHRLMLPPHADGFYISSALCNCGDWQWDEASAEAFADNDDVTNDWSEHFAAAVIAALRRPRE